MTLILTRYKLAAIAIAGALVALAPLARANVDPASKTASAEFFGQTTALTDDEDEVRKLMDIDLETTGMVIDITMIKTNLKRAEIRKDGEDQPDNNLLDIVKKQAEAKQKELLIKLDLLEKMAKLACEAISAQETIEWSEANRAAYQNLKEMACEEIPKSAAQKRVTYENPPPAAR